ncbi:MAG: arginase family protein [Candidatus Latescibacterota bacterium]|jgi:agmatinase
MTSLITPVPMGRPTFLDMPRCADLGALAADVAVIGVPFSAPYGMAASTSPSSSAPGLVREQSLRMVSSLDHYNFEHGGTIWAGRRVTVADCGDVAMQPGRFDENRAATTAAIAAILGCGALPIVLGGDHAITAAVLEAYRALSPIRVVQIDAHLDWRDERGGVRHGQSSPMRRASEMPWVGGMIQIGLSGAGSARQAEVDAARAYGSVLVRAEELHQLGVEAVLDRLPAAGSCYVTIDMDGLEAAIAPGVGWPSMGGLTYFETVNLLKGVAARSPIAGVDLVEIVPANDVKDVTSLLAARLIVDALGALAHAGRIGRPPDPVLPA